MAFSMLNDLWSEFIVRFVDFGEIVNHNCFNLSYASYFPFYGQYRSSKSNGKENEFELENSQVVATLQFCTCYGENICNFH